MDTKVKYQYTYFIYSYLLRNIEYKEYILKLLNNKKYKLKIFEKENDIELYNYFNGNIKKEYFSTFNLNKNNINYEKIINNKCLIFEYFLDHNIHGKIEKNNNIFFKISKIQLICFNTGICFLLLKTDIQNDQIFLKDVLNYNYKMKDIYSDFSKLKEYEKINIQTDSIENIKDFNIFIENVTMHKLQNNRFFTYAYTCVDSENWNNEINKLNNEFLKYVYVYPNNYDLTFDDENKTEELNEWKYLKIGFTNNSMNLLCNNLEISNYTKIPYKYENEYLYILLINLYKKELLKNIENNNIKINTINNYENICKELYNIELTENIFGEKINKKLLSIFNIKQKIDILNKKSEKNNEIKLIKKYKKYGKIILFILIISLIINLIFLL